MYTSITKKKAVITLIEILWQGDTPIQCATVVTTAQDTPLCFNRLWQWQQKHPTSVEI